MKLGIEGTVMSGTPALRVGRDLLTSAGIRRIQGIFNGTTNFILSKMEIGESYLAALSSAQAHGYAEADPTNDFEGYDSAAKVAILGRYIFGKTVDLNAINRKGITHLSKEDILKANASGMHWKLVGTLDTQNETMIAAVRPECLPNNHPLAQISGIDNAIVYSTDFLGDVTLIGPGAGRLQTGYAIVQDLISIFK